VETAIHLVGGVHAIDPRLREEIREPRELYMPIL
jgi:hypothetical protein